MTRSRSRSLALATLLFVLFLTFLDYTIVTVVLANVQGELHASVSQLQWVVNGYALTFAGLMLSFGAVGDLFGRKKVMLTGVAVFCPGSVIAAVAPNTDVLIAGRVVMGIGAAASEPGTLSMIRHLYADRAERAQALGIWAAVSSLGLALGPLIGGQIDVLSEQESIIRTTDRSIGSLIKAPLAIPAGMKAQATGQPIKSSVYSPPWIHVIVEEPGKPARRVPLESN